MDQLFRWLAELFQGARFWLIVLPWERAVRIRLGKRTALLGPGCHLRLPFLDDVRIVNNRLRIAQVPCSTVSTKDGKTITLAATLGFRITDPLVAMLTLMQPEVSSAAFAQSVIAGFLLERRLEEVKLPELEAHALAAIAHFAPGMRVEFLRVVDFAVVKTFRLMQEGWRPSTDHDRGAP